MSNVWLSPEVYILGPALHYKIKSSTRTYEWMTWDHWQWHSRPSKEWKLQMSCDFSTVILQRDSMKQDWWRLPMQWLWCFVYQNWWSCLLLSSQEGNSSWKTGVCHQRQVWKSGLVKPFDRLTKAQLQAELKSHGVNTHGMQKGKLEIAFKELQMGISNCTTRPKTKSWKSSPLQLRGTCLWTTTWPQGSHTSNIITEVVATTSGPMGQAVKTMVDTVLSKQTLRCSDYRKANLLILYAITEASTSGNEKLLQPFQSLVDIQEIVYSSP